MRAIIADLFRKSPLDPLHQHLLKVKECTKLLRPLIEAFIEANREKIEEKVKEISQFEHEADLIKNEIREHLPRRILMPIDRSDLLRFLREEDSIADATEDVAKLIEMRETRVPEKLIFPLLELVDKVMETVHALEKVAEELKVVVNSSFGRREEEKVSELIKQIDKKEFEADLIANRCTKTLLSMEKELDPISVFFLMRIIGELGTIADRAQNTGDRLRTIIAR